MFRLVGDATSARGPVGDATSGCGPVGEANSYVEKVNGNAGNSIPKPKNTRRPIPTCR